VLHLLACSFTVQFDDDQHIYLSSANAPTVIISGYVRVIVCALRDPVRRRSTPSEMGKLTRVLTAALEESSSLRPLVMSGDGPSSGNWIGCAAPEDRFIVVEVRARWYERRDQAICTDCARE
jgi:hypothetical protein